MQTDVAEFLGDIGAVTLAVVFSVVIVIAVLIIRRPQRVK
jgi:hypothetical protein